MRISFLFLMLFVISQHIHAQSDSTATKSGEVIDGEIIIEKEKKITLPKANKVFRKSELKSFNSDPLELDFIVFQPSFDWPNYKSDIPFQSVNKTYPSAKYQNYVKLGFGNYFSPLIAAGVSKTFEKIKVNSSLFHENFARGPINDDFSRSSNSTFDFSAKYQTKAFSIMPYLEVKNQQYNFYGNTNRSNTGFSNETPDEVRYNQLAFGTFISGSRKGFNYSLDAKAVNVSQRLTDDTNIGKEPYIQALSSISVKLDTSFMTGFDLEAHSSNYESGISYGRSLLQLSPWVNYLKNDLSIRAGFSVANSEFADNKASGFYPNLSLALKFNPEWSAHGFVDGGFDWNSLESLISHNQFLDDSLIIANTETIFKVGGGVTGTPLEHLKVKVEASYSQMNNLPFYVPSVEDSSRFIAIYDGDKVGKTGLILDAVYSPNSTSTYGARMEFAGYTLDNLDKPWHLPTFQLSINTTHNINQKVIFSTNLISLSGIEAPSFNPFGSEKLQTIIDLNMGVKYLITNRSSIFIDANNLLNKEYNRYIGYPVRGMTFKVGGMYRF